MPDSPAFPDPRETLEVDVHLVDALREDQEGAPGFALIDCREEDEYRFCRIDGARLVPLSSLGDLDLAALGERAQPMVIYCHLGMRSAQAAGFLRNKGFENAFSLAGGIEAWSTEIDAGVPRY